MKDLRPIRGASYIASLIARGEHEHQDFKYLISDARKIARSISAFANNDGGRLLVGVKDNGTIAGVRNEEDIFVVEEAASRFCSPEVKPEFTAFRCEGGAVVFRVEIAPAGPDRPVMVSEADGTKKAYFRVADENITAPPLMVRAWRERKTQHAFVMTDAMHRAMTILDSRGELTARSLAADAAISLASAEEIIITLLAMDILEFHYNGSEFILRAAEIKD